MELLANEALVPQQWTLFSWEPGAPFTNMD